MKQVKLPKDFQEGMQKLSELNNKLWIEGPMFMASIAILSAALVSIFKDLKGDTMELKEVLKAIIEIYEDKLKEQEKKITSLQTELDASVSHKNTLQAENVRLLDENVRLTTALEDVKPKKR